MLKKLGLTPLHKIIARLGINSIERGAYFDAYEVKAWAADELAILEKSELIAKSSQRKSCVTCQGCERLCTMPVSRYPSDEPEQQANAFIICTEDDGGRIEVDFEDLEQWHSSIESFANILPQLIQTRIPPDTSISQDGKWPLGLIKSKNGHVPIALTIRQAHGLALLIGDKTIPLKEVLSSNKKGLSIDNAFVRSMADESKEQESADDRARRIGKRKAELDKQGIKDVRGILAKEERVHPSMIQKILTRYNKLTDNKSTKKSKTVNSLFGMGNK